MVRHHGPNVHAVCDGYSQNTKLIEQEHRAKKIQSTEILFMSITIRQDRFLTNGANKARLIKGLTIHIEHAGIYIKVKVAEGDADTMTVHAAIDLAHARDIVQ